MAVISTASPWRASGGASTADTAASVAPDGCTTCTSTGMPSSARWEASATASPSVWRPSVTSTTRRRASSGRTAAPSRSAAARFVRSGSTRTVGPSKLDDSCMIRSSRASPPNTTTPARSSGSRLRSASATHAVAALRPAGPTEAEASSTNTVATRVAGRLMIGAMTAASREPATASRTALAMRHCVRPTPRERRASRYSAASTSSSARASQPTRERSPRAPRPAAAARRPSTGSRSAGASVDSDGDGLTATVRAGAPSAATTQNPLRSATGAGAPASISRVRPAGSVTSLARPPGTGSACPTSSAPDGSVGPAERGDQPIAEDREGHLEREVAVRQAERQVGEGPPPSRAPQEQGAAVRRRDEHVGRRGLDPLRAGHGHVGEVEVGEQRVVAADQRDGGALEGARRRHPGDARWRRDGEERSAWVGGHRHAVVDAEVLALAQGAAASRT